MREISKLEEVHKTTRSKAVKQELDVLILKLKLTDATSLAREVMFAKQQAFEYRDKPSRQLAHVLAESQEKTVLGEVMIS